MVTGKRPGVPMLTIDPYEGPSSATPPEAMRAFSENMDRIGAGPEVQLFWGTSEEAARSRSLVFRTAVARARVALDAATPFEVLLAAAAQEGPAPCGQRVFRVEKSSRTPEQTGIEDPGAEEPRIGLLFIDGLHDMASVLLDIDLWEPMVAMGGTVVFHDAFFREGVTLALFRRHLLNREFRYERSVVNASIFRRGYPLETSALVGSGLRMTARMTHQVRNELTTLGVRHDWRWLQRLFPPLPDFEYL
jgi:hypothetical protein